MFNSLNTITKSFLQQANKNLIFSQKFNFARMPTTQKTILTGKPAEQPTFSREYYQLISENPNYIQEAKQRERSLQKQLIEKELYQLKQNDQNPQNFIPVQLNNQFVSNSAKIRSKRSFNLQNSELAENKNDLSAHPFVIIHKPKEPKVTVTGLRKNIPSTLKKLRYPMKNILKRQVFDALTILDNMPTKAAKYMAQVLKQVIRHAKQKDMDINRLYVNGVVIGKQRRFKLLYYKAKMQMGVVNKDICQVKLTLEERPYKDMYKEIIQGKTPPTLAYILREQLKNQQADYQTLRKWSHVLTAKGRQQKRLMFKRKIIQKQQQYQRLGVTIEKKVIAQKLLEVEAEEWAQQYEQKRLELDQQSINKRTAIYKKNEEITGFN
ncbi:Ribosomal protein L22/L17 [Pseudocohnilembus persalinus]|uniref:Ribosomal protein L22/L17 n=1 Tax=Pseudocohnilembus persalinus TaxID=266149 RepID=A0A0V0Q952_PSEPJ|nr:Ribosomal protein L22/L17 [Pseudocohnilembus persalinus]|eukprot:KRW98771.1 Ribosomal protein L22/L17 [Pseudocohnilembus persalinus]